MAAKKINLTFLTGFCFFVFLMFANGASAFTINKPANFLTLNTGLVGWWTFDGKDTPWTSATAATTLDKSGNGNTGTLTNMAQATSPVVGKVGQALYFDGSNDYGLSTTLDLSGTNKISVAMWLLWPAYANDDDLAFEYPNNINNAAGGFFFDPNGAAGYINVAIKNNIGYNYAYYTRPTANVWHHFVAIYDKSQTVNEVELYIDGVYQTAVSRPGTSNNTDNFPNPSTGGFYLMSRAGTSLFGKGTIDDFRIYNRVLSASEITQLYNLGSAKFGVSPTLPLTSGLVGYWTFDGKDMLNGKALDRSGNGNTGTLVNIATSTFYQAGKLGQAFNFDGVNDYVTLGNNANFGGMAQFSACAWIYPKSFPAGGGIIMFGYNFPQIFLITQRYSKYFVSIKTTDNVWGNVFGAGVTTNNDMILNKWNHICFTYQSGNANFYSNGTFDKNSTLKTGNLATNTTDTRFGMDDNNYYFNGSLDDVRIYNRALTAGEIKQLYNIGAASKVASTPKGLPGQGLNSGLVGWWTFDGPKMISNVADSSASGLNAYLYGQTSTTSVAGKIGQGLSFDGVNDYVTMGDPASGVLDIGLQDWTASVWFKTTKSSVGQVYGMVSKSFYGGTTGRWAILQEGGNLEVLVSNAAGAGSTVTFSESSYLDNKWHLITMRVPRTGRMALYVDGVFKNDADISGYSALNWQSTYYLLIGAYNDNVNGQLPKSGTYFTGSLDDVRIYNRALTAGEIKQLYNLGR